MSSTDHIGGENQTIKTFMDVMSLRATAFSDWVHATVQVGATADESDWDDAYVWWFENIETALEPSDMTFLEYVQSIA